MAEGGGMNCETAIDRFIADMQMQGRLTSPSSERGYRSTLIAHAEDVQNRDPSYVSREDVKRTLRRWSHPNTQGTNRSKLVSFYAWAMEEGIRKDNPALQTRRPRRRAKDKYRLTEAEVVAMLQAATAVRERRAIFLGLCAGLRNAELRGLQGRHFARSGFVWVSADIAKGGRERWVPMITDLEPVVAEIRADVQSDEYVLPAQRFRNPPFNTNRLDLRHRPSSSQALRQLVMRVAEHAGIAAHVSPHDMRHAYAEHIARKADTRVAQHLLGHAHLGTTETYLGHPRLDDMATAVKNATYGIRTNVLGVAEDLQIGLKATTGIEPV
jgi:integrase/recombinase XerD